MGMPLYACIPPTGYSSKADAWVSTGELVTRMNFSLSLATNHFPGITTTWAQPEPQVTTPETAEQNLEARLIPTGVSDRTRNAVLSQQQDQATAQKAAAAQAAALDRRNAQLAGLLLGSPEFQRR
jgi:uncharacterized protein (DUF1800 family)